MHGSHTSVADAPRPVIGRRRAPVAAGPVTARRRSTAAGARDAMLQRRRFPAMGTWVECLVDASRGRAVEAALRAVEDEFARLEAMLSRFRRDSELSRLNRERSIAASDELRELVELSVDARERTGGRFDPTLHDAICAAGYDRTFNDIVDEGGRGIQASGCGEVVLRGNHIELGAGASLDLGGIAKGYAADRCAAMLAAHGPALVNAGGDLAVSGPRADEPWAVGVEVPGHSVSLALDRGGLATSGRDRRRWRRDGEDRHHIIDPLTLRPAENAPLSVTVAAGSATEAEILAKAVFLAPDARHEAELRGTPAVIVEGDGHTRLVGLGT
jgi:thiamine biosynthesis lipoprotein